MLRATGAGKIEIDTHYARPGMCKALLFNFDIDGDTIKPEHRAFLASHVVPLMADGHGHAWMRSSASRSGSDAHNLQLSQRRIYNLAAVLRSCGILDTQMQLQAIGESNAKLHALEDERDRAVELVVLPIAKSSPPPERPIPPPPAVNTRFKIRMLGALGGSAGPFQVENCFFQIADDQNRVTAFFTYSSIGVGRGALPVNVSVTMRGDWNSFTTNRALRVSQFEGATRFTTGGGGNHTLNYLNMMGLPKGVTTLPAVLSIQTGFTVGIGASTSIGKLIWYPREEMIYNGD